MSCWSPVGILLATLACFAVFQAETAEAKRGCASFGHSCYGGMGKRSSDILGGNEEILQDVQIDENPAFVFTGPRSEYKPQRLHGLTPKQYDNISRIIRQWMQSYRKAQEIQDDSI